MLAFVIFPRKFPIINTAIQFFLYFEVCFHHVVESISRIERAARIGNVWRVRLKVEGLPLLAHW
jgi:hypothetical protein